MSMINELVKKIRLYASEYNEPPYGREVKGTGDLLKEAADMIEELSSKLSSVNLERSEQYYKGNSEFVEKLIERLEAQPTEQFVGIYGNHELVSTVIECCVECVNQLAEEYKDVPDTNVGKWIPVRERLPECDNKYGWVSCIVSVIRSHYPTSSYDICDSPYDENIVMHADYHVSQKIWHLDCDEQLNALMDIEDSPLNGDYVVAWKPLPEPYKGE